MHNGFVTVDSEKMSKSVGNFFTIREVLNRYHPMALRWLLLGTQYRAPINYRCPIIRSEKQKALMSFTPLV
jgi:cysteinyl-tRNA synthetase